MLTINDPDYASIRAALQRSLSSKESWRDLGPSGTGQTLIDFIAAVGATDQYAIQHAFREAFRTARLDSSILAQSIMMGVRLGRKTPSGVPVLMSKLTDDLVTIPAYTQFTSSTGLLFNREALVLRGADQIEATLYEGEIVTTIVRSDGNPYQIFVSGDDGFRVADGDVQVLLNNVPLPITQRGLWRFRGKSGVADASSATGQLVLTFGSDSFGTQPKTSDTVIVRYALTNGAAGQSVSILGDNIVLPAHPEVKTQAIGALSGGTEEKSSLFYRKLSPQLFSAETIATTKDEFSAKAAEYPGVHDAKVIGQRELAPADPRWMNLVQVTLLTDKRLTGEQWDAFEKWYKPQYMYPVRLHRRDATPVPINISLRLSCQARADLATVKAAAETNIRRIFQLRPGLLDSNVYISDIHAAARGADAAVEYVELFTPTVDAVVAVKSPTPLRLTRQETGTLPAGQYSYAVTCVTPQGETLATNFKSIWIEGGGVSIEWAAVPQASAYNVYGHNQVELGLLGSTTGTGFVDNGAKKPTSGLPIATGAGFRYPALGTLDVQVRFTSREFYDLGNIR